MSTVFQMLEDEWCRLSRDSAAARRLREVCELAGRAGSLADVERFVRTASPVEADRVLLALVARAVDRDALAGRVLLQLLLPGTRGLARRWWALGDHDERAAAAVAAVYNRIRSYPLARRPARVAANILMDAAQELRRAVGRGQELTTRGPVEDPVELRHPAAELGELLLEAVDAGVIGRDDAELIAHSRIGGARIADLAARRGLRPRTIWDRRRRAEMALAAACRQDQDYACG